MSKPDDFPTVPPKLLQALQQAFPDRLPLTYTGHSSDLPRLVGQQEVIRFLKEKAKQQHNNVQS